jgi:hypothetical protein
MKIPVKHSGRLNVSSKAAELFMDEAEYIKSMKDLDVGAKGTEPKMPKEDINRPANKLLIALTEAPNTNILKWNTKIYESYGTVRKMIATGYHTLEVWRSILFQLVYACAVLEKNEICFNNFSLENNVYIKDVQTDNTGDSCWVYRINNIEYYIPNYGYVLVLDSKYTDVKEVKDEIQYKIYGNIFTQNSNVTDFGKLVKTTLIGFMNNESFKINKSNDLELEVEKIVRNIKRCLEDSNYKTIGSIIPDCFPEFFNNKVGKLLTKLEKESFSIFNKPDYREGNLMVRQKRYDEYEWVIYKGSKDGKRIIVTKDQDGKLIEKDVFASSLFSYPEQLKPEEIKIIETYTFE